MCASRSALALIDLSNAWTADAMLSCARAECTERTPSDPALSPTSNATVRSIFGFLRGVACLLGDTSKGHLGRWLTAKGQNQARVRPHEHPCSCPDRP